MGDSDIQDQLKKYPLSVKSTKIGSGIKLQNSSHKKGFFTVFNVDSEREEPEAPPQDKDDPAAVSK